MDNNNIMDLAMGLSMASLLSKSMGNVLDSAMKQQYPGAIGEPNVFAMINGKKCGPYTPEDIARFMKEGTVNDDTYVWQAGMNDWMQIKNVIALKK